MTMAMAASGESTPCCTSTTASPQTTLLDCSSIVTSAPSSTPTQGSLARASCFRIHGSWRKGSTSDSRALKAASCSTQRQASPDLRIHARIAEDPLALVLDDVDVILSFGGKLPEGPWVSHEIMRVPELLVAHPDYLAAHGTPRTLGELSTHPILLWDAPEKPGHVLPLKKGGDFPIDPILKSSDLHVLRECAAAGLGIGRRLHRRHGRW